MKRYQVYLNPHSVSILDDFEKIADFSRSKVIRMAVDRLAYVLSRAFVTSKTPTNKKYILDSLISSIQVKDKGTTNYATRDDALYLKD